MKKLVLSIVALGALAFSAQAQNPTTHQEEMDSVATKTPCFLSWPTPGAFQGFAGHDFTGMTWNQPQGTLDFSATTHGSQHGPLYYTLSSGDAANCNAGKGLVDISAAPKLEIRAKATVPMTVTVYVQEGNGASWDYSKFSRTSLTLNLTTAMQTFSVDTINAASISGTGSIDLSNIGGVAFELGKADGKTFDQVSGATVSIDYIRLADAVAGSTGGGATCSDGIQNQDETGIDCGGTSCSPCNTGGTGSSCTGAKSDAGHGTWYNNLDVQPNGVVRCSFERSTILGTKYGAMDKGLLQEDNNAKYCGMCVEATGQKGTAIIQIVDECPDCYDRNPDGSINTGVNTKYGDIDLSIEAFQAIVATDHVKAGIGDFTWTEVSCPWSTPISLRFESASQWNVKVIIANHLNRVAKVELTDKGIYYDMVREAGNGWVLGTVNGGSISGATKSIRVTDIYGSVITVDNIDFTTDKLWETYATTKQFPACTVTSTGELVNSLDYVSAFPNPANTNITFVGLEDANSIEIVNMRGQVVGSKNLAGNSAQISFDISDLASGIYVARMIGSTNSGTVTFVKQ